MNQDEYYIDPHNSFNKGKTQWTFQELADEVAKLALQKIPKPDMKWCDNCDGIGEINGNPVGSIHGVSLITCPNCKGRGFIKLTYK